MSDYGQAPKPSDNPKFRKVLKSLNRGFKGKDTKEEDVDKPEPVYIEPGYRQEGLPPDEFEINRKKALDEIGRKSREARGLPSLEEEREKENKRQLGVALRALEQAEKEREDDEDYLYLTGDR
jgi:hypothetical protein